MSLTPYNSKRVKIPPTTKANDRGETLKEKKREGVETKNAWVPQLARDHPQMVNLGSVRRGRALSSKVAACP